jgi:peptide/nickel transport system substrate-binding protein
MTLKPDHAAVFSPPAAGGRFAAGEDPAKRQQMYDDIQHAHTDSSPFLFMFQDSRKVAMRSNVKGVVLGITFSDDRYGAVTKE